SGLKTAVLYALHGQNAQSREILLDETGIGDLSASFQEAVVDVLVAKTRQALARTGQKRRGVGGGVAANQRFRQRIGAMADALAIGPSTPPAALVPNTAPWPATALPKLGGGQAAALEVEAPAGRVRPGRLG